MKRKSLGLLLLLVLVLILTGCGKTENKKLDIAFVTDIGSLLDKSYNQGTWEGIKEFATENNLEYNYYQPANIFYSDDNDRYEAMKKAVDSGATLVVAAGFRQANALRDIAKQYPDVKFVYIDGALLTDNTDNDGKEIGNPLSNVVSISFKEEQSGYLAGYAIVMEGYTKLGFAGGGAMEDPSVNRFGYGYLQGISDAAKTKSVEVNVKMSYAYGDSYQPSSSLERLLSSWYEDGTEVIFSCGGNMCRSCFKAAKENDKLVIGVDVDQSNESDTVITSALKGLKVATKLALKSYYDGNWDSEMGGKNLVFGVKEGAVGLPQDTWKFTNYTKEEYSLLLKTISDGVKVIDDNYIGYTEKTYDKVTIEFDS